MAEVDDIPIGFSESDFARVREVVRYVESSFPPSGNGRPRLPPPTPDGIPIYNDTGGTLGKYSLVRPNAIRLVEKKIFIDVKEPDTTFSWLYLVVGDNDIPASSYGLAQRGPMVKVLYDTGTPTIGQRYGAKPSQKTASRGYPPCLKCAGIYDAGDKIMWAWISMIDKVLVKTVGAHDKGDTQNCAIYAGTTKGSESDTGMEVEDTYNRYLDLDDDVWGVVSEVNDGPELIVGECSP